MYILGVMPTSSFLPVLFRLWIETPLWDLHRYMNEGPKPLCMGTRRGTISSTQIDLICEGGSDVHDPSFIAGFVVGTDDLGNVGVNWCGLESS